MSETDRLLDNNAAYAAGYDDAGWAAAPSRKVTVVTCMDARMDVPALLGLAPGEAHVLRNAGGVVTDDVIRSLLLSQRLLGTVEVALIHHTDCGLQKFRDDELKDEIERETGVRPPFALGAFADVEQDVRESIARVRESPFLPRRDAVRGFVYEVETGRLREVG